MSLDIDVEAFAGSDPIFAIAEEVFTAMIDGEPGHVQHWDGDDPTIPDAVHAWVDVRGPYSGRVVLTAPRPTVDSLTRALLGMDEDEAVGEADMVDAFGEVANVVGGNIKALVQDESLLSLPEVAVEHPEPSPDGRLYSLALDWRTQPIVVGLWALPDA